MRKHNGMRLRDIVVLLKIITIEKEDWQFKDLAAELFLSAAEVSESLNRSGLAGLVSDDKRRVNRLNVLEFIQHGMDYVFPQVPGAMVNGIPMAHSHPYFQKQFAAELKYVWPHAGGKQRGAAVLPLY